ncbi:hypothetical protein MKW94_024481 [Papaver nudicaule]|uniref:Uncharacterized protein n=1 Tax=Papaver nudicaule TaxID=74823 RepID=A0AA41SIH3_PAPNU|nr:hypothetical protein [Papaver nudicaule]MCL7046772.1 hypothetical protein [Papaver nudicaule]
MASNHVLRNNRSIDLISPQYCMPYQLTLHIDKKVKKITEGRQLGVFDIYGNHILKIKTKFFRRRLVLVNAARVPVVSLKPMRFTLHDRWKVYRGDSSNSKNLLFSIKRSKFLQFKTRLDVFLASNKAEDVYDFKIKQNSGKSCFIYRGNSNNNLIAEMHKTKTVHQVRGKDIHSATIHPNVDYAFIIALRVVLDEINKPSSRGDDGFTGGCGGGCGGCGG